MLNEPSVVAVEKSNNKILAVGAEARDMLGRTPQRIVAVRPLKEGVIANDTITQKMLEYIVNKVEENPLECVAIGTGKALDNLDKLRPGTIYSNDMF